MYLIVGLGNPDQQYQTTRHNVGFMFLDALAKKIAASGFKLEKKIAAEVASGKWQEQKVILLKPQTYVNNSGLVVKKSKLFYKIPLTNIIIIHDDLDVPLGMTKLTSASGSGGHKGVQSILTALKTEKIHRLKIGLANGKLTLARHQRSDQKRKAWIAHFVLSPFSPTEKATWRRIFQEGVKKLESLVS